MTALPRVSILLPAHNRGDVIQFSIESVLVQNFQDFELLIVRDGCTDNTAEVVQSYLGDKVFWFDLTKAPNFGYANRNKILKLAKGAFIAYISHDDLISKDHLTLALDAFVENLKLEIVFLKHVWVSKDLDFVPSTFTLNDKRNLKQFLKGQKTRIVSSSIVHKRSCFDKYGYWNERLEGSGDVGFPFLGHFKSGVI